MTAGSFVLHVERRRGRGRGWRRETCCEETGYLEARKQKEIDGGDEHISRGKEPRLRGERAMRGLGKEQAGRTRKGRCDAVELHQKVVVVVVAQKDKVPPEAISR